MPILIVFIVVSAVEIVVVDLIVHRWWPAGRIPLLVLGIWGVTFMLGMLFGMLVRQHAVGPDGIRVRSGSEVDIPLTWDDIYAVALRKRTIQEKAPRVTVNEQGEATLHLRMMNETNLEIRLEQPTPVKLPHGTETVSLVAFYADDPKAFLAEARRHLQPGERGYVSDPAWTTKLGDIGLCALSSSLRPLERAQGRGTGARTQSGAVSRGS